jgi:hypothetical protein
LEYLSQVSSQLEFLLLLACFIGFHPMFITGFLTVPPIIIIVFVYAVAGNPCDFLTDASEDSLVAGIPSGSGVLFLKLGGYSILLSPDQQEKLLMFFKKVWFSLTSCS